MGRKPTQPSSESLPVVYVLTLPDGHEHQMTPDVAIAVDRKNAERAAAAMIAGCDACEALGRSALVEAIAASALERGDRVVKVLARIFARTEKKRVADASKTPAPRKRR